METLSKKKKDGLDKEQMEKNHSPEQPQENQQKQKRTRKRTVHEAKPAMETRSQKRQRMEEISRDRISDLPDDILHHVLSSLPIQLIARASVLSKRWNTLWLNYPRLDFSGFVPNPKAKPKTDEQGKAMEFLTELLSLHNPESVKVFRISSSRVSKDCLDECVALLSERHSALEELELDVDLNSNLNGLHLHDLFGLRNLKVLKLKSECATLSPFFLFPISYAVERAGFRSLHTLSLHRVKFTEISPSMDNLFSGNIFPSLKNLHMRSCWGISCLTIACPALLVLDLCWFELTGLDIDCPKVEELNVENCFRKISGGTWVKVMAPSLHRFNWLSNEITDEFSVVYSGILSYFIVSFPSGVTRLNAKKAKSAAALWSVISSTRTLSVQYRVIEYLSGIHFAGTLPKYFNNLWSLQFDTGLSEHDMPGIVRLLRSSPVLSTLKINVNNEWKNLNKYDIDLVNDPDFSSEQYFESQAGSIESFKRKLRVVKIAILGKEVYETTLDLIKFLLKHGKVLQEMTITSNMEPPLPKRNISLQIMEFPRASSNVKLSFPLASTTDVF